MLFLIVLLASVPLPQPQSVVGQVVSADEEGVALPGIEVCITGTTICAITDAHGRFELRGLGSTDHVELTTRMSGFQNGEHTVTVCHDQTTTVTLLLGLMGGGDCTLHGDQESMRYEVSGTIVSAKVPISRATLTLRNYYTGKVVWTGHSSRRGTFAATGLREGTYALDVSKSGYQLQRVTVARSYCGPENTLRIPLAKACK
jgi:hypothetical protein